MGKKTLHTFFLLFFVWIFSYSKAQDKVLDSLNSILKTHSNDTVSLKAKIALGDYLEIFRVPYWDSLLTDAEKYGTSKNRSTIINNKGFILMNNGDLEEALVCFEKCMKIDSENNDLKNLSYSYHNIGMIYLNKGNTPLSLDYLLKSLKIKEERDDKTQIPQTLNNLGYLYSSQKEYVAAIDYYKKSLKLFEDLSDKKGIALAYNNLGFNHMKLGDTVNAIVFYKKSLALRREINDKKGVANVLHNMGGIYLEKNDLKNALESFQTSLALKEEIGDKGGVAQTLSGLGGTYFKLGELDKALDAGLRALNGSQELGFAQATRDAANLLNKVYAKKNNYLKAYEMYQLYVSTRDSISNQETQKLSIRGQYKYEYDKKAAADSINTAAEKMITTAQLKQEQTQRYALYGGVFLLIVFGGFMFNRFNISQKQKKVIEFQKSIVEEKQKEIIDSITYAKRIQKSNMPTEKYIEYTITRLKNNRL